MMTQEETGFLCGPTELSWLMTLGAAPRGVRSGSVPSTGSDVSCAFARTSFASAQNPRRCRTTTYAFRCRPVCNPLAWGSGGRRFESCRPDGVLQRLTAPQFCRSSFQGTAKVALRAYSDFATEHDGCQNATAIVQVSGVLSADAHVIKGARALAWKAVVIQRPIRLCGAAQIPALYCRGCTPCPRRQAQGVVGRAEKVCGFI